MKDWNEIRTWRRETRAELLARRLAVGADERERIRSRFTELLLREIPELRAAIIGFCWPFKGEVDCRPLIRDCIAAGGLAALPVVVQRAQPLEFWAWQPRMKMRRGIWDIPIPAERQVVRPTILLVPLVGFDREGYRLGYGGGYFDRTLAVMTPRPLTIGMGYERTRLATIHPQRHDIAMDVVLTEKGLTRFGDTKRAGGGAQKLGREEWDAAGSFASPPCFLHERDWSG